MDSIPLSSMLSFDHTFEVSSNIGYSRKDGKWVTLYSSVFLCMNELGQVVGWQFTSTTSLDEVCELLTHIKSRLQQPEIPIQVFVDNCCSVKNKVRDIFGKDTDIKLG